MPPQPPLASHHILLFAKKANTFVAEHKHILLALKQQGCHLSLLAQVPKEAQGETNVCSPSLTQQNIVDIYPITFSDHGKNPLREAIILWNILRLLYRLRPQIVIAYTLKPILYSAIANKLLSPFLPKSSPFRLVAVFTGLGRVFTQRTPLHKILTLLLRTLLRNTAQLWVLNQHNKTFLQTFLHSNKSHSNKSHPPSILVSKDMGIDLTRFRPPPHKTKPRAQKPLLRFLFLGRLLKAKGVSEYLQAARLLQHEQQLEFWLAGSAEQTDPDHIPQQEMEKAAAQGIVTWLGEHKRVEDLLASAEHPIDCLVLPSYAEGLPRVILEAAAMRIPAIVARYPGWQRAVVENKTALLCACRDAHALAETMRTFASLPLQQKRAMGEAAHAFVVREFSQEEARRFYIEALTRVAQEAQKKTRKR